MVCSSFQLFNSAHRVEELSASCKVPSHQHAFFPYFARRPDGQATHQLAKPVCPPPRAVLARPDRWAEPFEQVSLPDIEKVRVENTEFAVKCRLLRQQPARKFLLYFVQAQPPDEENWLLDVQLAGYVFRTDLTAQHLTDLGLDAHYRELLENHAEFFRNARHRERLAALLTPAAETEVSLRVS